MNFLYGLPPLITGLLILLLGLFVWVKNVKNRVNESFFLLCFSTFLWLGFYGFSFLQVRKVDTLMLLFKIGYAGVIFIPVFWFAFIVNFLNEVRFKKLVNISYFIAVFFLLTLIFTNSFITGIRKYFWGYYPVAIGSLLHPIFLSFYILLWMFSVKTLFFSLIESHSAIARAKIKYVFFSLLIATPGVLDFAPNYGIRIYPFAWVLVTISIITMAYAIIKHHLMDIRVAVTRTGIFLFVYTLVLSVPYKIVPPDGWNNWWNNWVCQGRFLDTQLLIC